MSHGQRLPVLALGLGLGLCHLAAEERAPVTVVRTPDGGIQPQAAVDSRGRVRLIYFKGKPEAGDVYYAEQLPRSDRFLPAIRVNTTIGAAVALGSIRGAHLALGKKDRVHVAWMASPEVPKAIINGEGQAPMLYARMNDSGSAFEPERNVMTWTGGLDGGGSVAADPQGNVYVTWHGVPPDNKDAEAGRAVFLARSRDDGKTFAREEQVSPANSGACGCCGMRAFADQQGHLMILYRAAIEQKDRNMTLLVGDPARSGLQSLTLSRWRATTCLMSSASLAEGGGSVLAAWEQQNQIQFTPLDPSLPSLTLALEPSGEGKRQHPTVARNAKGEILLAWTENTGWDKGGSLAWQRFDAAGKALEAPEHRDGVPAWGLVAAVAKPDGSFVIFY